MFKRKKAPPHGLSNEEVALLYEEYGGMVLRRARRFFNDDSDAEEAMQRVFLKLMRSGAPVNAARSPRAYIITATDNSCRDVQRKQGRTEELTSEPADPAQPDSSASDTPFHIRAFLRRLAEKLTLREKKVLEHLLSGKSQGEIAQELELSRQTINVLVCRVRESARTLDSSGDYHEPQ